MNIAQAESRTRAVPDGAPAVEFSPACSPREHPVGSVIVTPPVMAAFYFLALALSIVVFSFPTRRDGVFIAVGAGLLLASVGRPKAWKRILRDWLPLFAILTLYDTLRAHADSWGVPHVLPQIHADESMFGGTIPTVWLQDLLYTPGSVHWWDYGMFVVYVSHFVVPIATAAVLWRLAYPKFRRYTVLFVTLTFAAFATYALYPAAPPWLASRDGVLAPTTKIIDEMWAHVGMASGAELLSGTSNLANPVAAIPSLHAAYPFLLMLVFWGTARFRYRLLLALYPLAMGFTLVYSAEHYVVDILLGWFYAIVVFVVGSAVIGFWSRHARARLMVIAATAPSQGPSG